MKWFYLIGEVHPDYHYLTYYPFKDSKVEMSNSLRNYVIKRCYAEYRVFKLRRKKIGEILEKVKPKVVFVEGKQTNLWRKEIPYNGKIVFLDDENPAYELFEKKVEEIFKQAEKCEEKMLEHPEKLTFKFIEELERAKEREIYSLITSELAGIYREYFWYKKILKHYKNPSLLICGAGHLVNWKNFLRFMITPNLQLQRGIIQHLLYRKRNIVSRLIDWLELEGIKTKLVGILNYTC